MTTEVAITPGSASMRRTSRHDPEPAVHGMPLLAVTARQRQGKTARYLAENLPVIETGRQLSLEQVPTVGLRN
ncbi:hypothetical protein E5170_24280 [Pseudomonas atacamensis]|uniref:Uncharacterized protein n=1 Tax=Pseudomonas atacamensis TaxID=2565368 RepID=A0AAQ2D7Q8_9PSED|nr:hypothetical protein DMX04_00070 [Pseudomonas koreensis]RRW52572.1 hypothetical protein EGJ55_21000 [Pseudomonas moraviensis]THF27719.1 hypothetical protein E5170_24280 [Pseudomonas atacamensis]